MYYWMSPPDRGIYSGVSGRRKENHERFESWLFGFFLKCRANVERRVVRHWLHFYTVKNFSKLYLSLSTVCCHRLGRRLSSSASHDILHYATSSRNAVKIFSVIANIFSHAIGALLSESDRSHVDWVRVEEGCFNTMFHCQRSFLTTSAEWAAAFPYRMTRSVVSGRFSLTTRIKWYCRNGS
jgi:hypothetical protein